MGDAHTQRKGHVRTQREGSHLRAKERGPRQTNLANTLILNFQPQGL